MRKTQPGRLEYSCGALVFQRNASPPRVLLVQSHWDGHWSFPKGHVEKGENTRQTALREVFEETGIRARLLSEEVLDRRHYGLPTGVRKRVDYFLAEGEGETRPQPEEVLSAAWVELDEALRLLSFREDRSLLRRVRAEHAQEPPRAEGKESE